MITGLGLSELMVVFVLVLVFFGSKELPQFIREGARLMARVKRYGDKVRREMDEIVRPVNEARVSVRDETGTKKQELRRKYLEARKSLSAEDRLQKSALIKQTILDSAEYKKARVVMGYMATQSEVMMQELFEQAAADGKRVVMPYCKIGSRDLGIAEVRDFKTQLAPGTLGILEPVAEIRDNFLRSDLELIIVPGVAFDRYGGRLGWGKAYYDNFLRELKGRQKIWGVAFACQITDQSLPFDYHDVSVDLVVTDQGLIPDRSAAITE